MENLGNFVFWNTPKYKFKSLLHYFIWILIKVFNLFVLLPQVSKLKQKIEEEKGKEFAGENQKLIYAGMYITLNYVKSTM